MSSLPPDEPTDIEAAEAALEAVAPDRLLVGEDENTTRAEDAVHWVKVYTELLEFKRSILAKTEESVATMDPVAIRAASGVLAPHCGRPQESLSFGRASPGAARSS